MADFTNVTRVSQEEFLLDTKNFNTMITQTQRLAEAMRDLKADLDKIANNLSSNWIGSGSNAFQTKYKIMTRQLTDIKDEIFEIAERVSSDYNAYLQYDTDIAKSQVGVENRY